ncbi:MULTISPECIES: GNAT family N-acetyltransferase [Rhodomicrobium]|uniref:GNAT family N-acetyltransferase n=1 Tax=Rhodomicrobium TaxID=1068 RepID=UPI000B4ABF74|nr:MULTISPECIES: GNAT family N-acetyltransferase [Rhodomicrobium]
MVNVRDLRSADLEAVTRIYAHHVAHGTGTFDEVAPSLAEMAEKYETLRAAGLPWLIAEADGDILGYAYAAPFRTRTAYRFTLEDSVYIAPGAQRRGVGRALLAALIARCEALGYRQLLAVIGDSENHGSVGLHRALGFTHTGTSKSVGLKFGRWLDVVFMQLSLGEGDKTPPNDASTA